MRSIWKVTAMLHPTELDVNRGECQAGQVSSTILTAALNLSQSAVCFLPHRPQARHKSPGMHGSLVELWGAEGHCFLAESSTGPPPIYQPEEIF